MFSRRAAEQEQEDNGGIEGPGLLESSLRSVGQTGLTGAQASLSLFLSPIAPSPGADSSFLCLEGKQSLESCDLYGAGLCYFFIFSFCLALSIWEAIDPQLFPDPSRLSRWHLIAGSGIFSKPMRL